MRKQLTLLLIGIMVCVSSIPATASADVFDDMVSQLLDIQAAVNEVPQGEVAGANANEIAAVSSAYLDNGRPFNVGLLRVEENRRTAYIKFQDDQLKDVSSATLVLKQQSDKGDGVIRVYLGDHTGWDGTSISKDSAPKKGKLLGTVSGHFDYGKTYTVNLNGLPKSDAVSLVLEIDSPGRPVIDDVAFANSGSNGPKLRLSGGGAASKTNETSTEVFEEGPGLSPRQPTQPSISETRVSQRFVVGDTIRTLDSIRVRSSAGLDAASQGIQPAGVVGKVIDGPVLADDYTWVKLNYETGPDGWSVIDWLTEHNSNSVTVNTIKESTVSKGVYQSGNGTFVFEIESVPATGSWRKESDKPGYTGSGYYAWRGDNQYRTSGIGVLAYTFEVKTAGKYTLNLRGRRDKDGRTVASDHENDVYVQMDNTGWKKIFQGGAFGQWLWATKLDHQHKKLNAEYQLSAGKHTLYISGRSKNYKIDRAIIFSDGKQNQARNLSVNESTQTETTGSYGQPEVPEQPSTPAVPTVNDFNSCRATSGSVQDTTPRTCIFNGKSYSEKTIAINTAAGSVVSGEAKVTGELRLWHKVSLTFDGPETSESADPNPFMFYRMNVTFTAPSGMEYVVPGYFAADGNAANTSAKSGDKWRVHFAPTETGPWTWKASIRKGSRVAVSSVEDIGASAGYFDGQAGSFTVGATDKTGRDMRAKGLLQNVGQRYLRFAGNGQYFVKAGTDAPENFLAYKDFDNDTNQNHKNLIKTWSAHEKDWDAGDPTWKSGKGKGIIGAVNYLRDEGLNVFSFLTNNVLGDDRNVFPYVAYNESKNAGEDRKRFDVSKLDQWGIVFDHGTNNGFYLHFKTFETENDTLLDSDTFGDEYKVYYRELVARFGHNLALNWNLGEEYNESIPKLTQIAKYVKSIDPYEHPVVVHTYPGNENYDKIYTPMVSVLDGASVQSSNFQNAHASLVYVQNIASKAGKKWVVAMDEPGQARDALDCDGDTSNHEIARKDVLWPVFMAGSAGVEWYFGYDSCHGKSNQSDLTAQDFRSRDNFWDYNRHILQFFTQYVPFWKMNVNNGLTSAGNDYVLAAEGDTYVIYLKNGGTTNIKLQKGTYAVQWFDPRNGGSLRNGTKNSVNAAQDGQSVSIGAAPNNTGQDWAVILRKNTSISEPELPEAPQNPGSTSENKNSNQNTSSVTGSGDFLSLHFDNSRDFDDAQAAVATRMIVDKYKVTNYIAVTGTVGKADKIYRSGSEPTMKKAFGNKLWNAWTDYNGTVNKAKDAWIKTLENGHRVNVSEGGRDGFTADVLRKIKSERPGLNLKNVHVYQHSLGNEKKSLASDLAYTKKTATYHKIDDGNQSNKTPDFKTNDNAAAQHALKLATYGPMWAEAFKYFSYTKFLDFSDAVIPLWIVSGGNGGYKNNSDFLYSWK